MFRATIPPIIRSTMLYMAFQVGRYTYVVISKKDTVVMVGK